MNSMFILENSLVRINIYFILDSHKVIHKMSDMISYADKDARIATYKQIMYHCSESVFRSRMIEYLNENKTVIKGKECIMTPLMDKNSIVILHSEHIEGLSKQ